MASDLLDNVFKQLKNQILVHQQELDKLSADTEIAGYAQELRPLTLAEANAIISGTFGVAMVWISDGRKDLEGAGSGTGCAAILDQGQSPAVWLRTSDYTAVVI